MRTLPSLVPYRFRVSDLHWEVAQWDGTNAGWSTAESPSTAVLDGLVTRSSTKVLLEDSDRYIKQKEDVAVKLSALRSAAVISTKLVTTIDTTHALVVRDDRLWTWNGSSGTIHLPPEDCPLR